MTELAAAIRLGDVEAIRQHYVVGSKPTDFTGTWMHYAAALGTKTSVETIFELEPSTLSGPHEDEHYPIMVAMNEENVKTLEAIHRLQGGDIDAKLEWRITKMLSLCTQLPVDAQNQLKSWLNWAPT